MQFFQSFSATSTQNCVHSASVRCANSRTLLRPFNEAAVRSDPKRHAPDVEITQIFCRSFTKKMQIISGISARRAHKKMRAFAQRALLELLNVAASVYRVGCAFKSEKSAHSASTSRKFCAEVARKKRKIFRISARRAHKICVHSTSVRSENRRMSLQLFTESEICSHRKMRASGVRDHANFAPNSCERIANFSEF